MDVFLILIMVMLFLIWFLQIFFLNNYYEKMKVIETQKTIATITDNYKKMEQDAFFDKVKTLVDSDDIFVKVISKDKDIFISNEQVIAYKKEIQKVEDALQAVSINENSIALTLKGEKTQRETWVYAGYLDASH